LALPKRLDHAACDSGGDLLRAATSGETYGEDSDLHCLLVPAVAGYGNAVLINRVVGGIKPAICPSKVITQSGFACQRDRAFSFRGVQCAPRLPAAPSRVSMTSARLKRRVFPPIRKLGITPLLAQMQTARSVTE
jgi:hypothetical protein